MKYRELQIQTQREFPNNARTPGFGWLVRAGYVTRENEILPLGQQVISRLQDLSTDPSFLFHLSSWPARQLPPQRKTPPGARAGCAIVLRGLRDRLSRGRASRRSNGFPALP